MPSSELLTLKILLFDRQASIGEGENVGVAEALSFDGTLLEFDGHDFKETGAATVSFLCDWRVDEDLGRKLWDRIQSNPEETLGRIHVVEDGEYRCFCHIGVKEKQFYRLIAESMGSYSVKLSMECQLNIAVGADRNFDEKLPKGLYPVVGWKVLVKASEPLQILRG